MNRNYLATSLVLLLGSLAPALQAAVYLDAVQGSSPLASYSLNEAAGSTTTVDANYNGGTAFDGTSVNSVTFGGAGPATAGMSIGNTSASFGGANDVSIGGLGTFGSGMITAGGFSFVAWVSTTNTSSGALISFRNASGTNQNLIFQINRKSNDTAATNALRLYLRDQSGHQISSGIDAPTANITDGNWHMLAVSVSLTATPTVSFFVDGVSAGTTGYAASQQQAQTNVGNWSVGALGTSFGGSPGFSPTAFYTGSMDEVAIYDRVLSGSDVANLYSAALGVAVPEPGSFALLGLGATALSFTTRRRTRR